jgi:serine/threonine protein kinase
MDTFLTVPVLVSAVVLAGIVVVVLVVAIRRRRQRCTVCGARMPRKSTYCPRCGSESEQGGDVDQETSDLPFRSFELVVTKGARSSQRVSIPPEGLSIGRHPDNDVALSGELMVSRHHAVIAVEQGQYVLYDRDSANGTWVNDQRVFRHILAPGDRIQFWQTEFVFNRTGAPVPSPVPTIPPLAVVHVTGQQFGEYMLETLVGRGGMSEVFKARNRNGQVVAIKILQQTDPYLVTKFVQEGNEIGPLLRNHPNIVYVHEFGKSADNRLYIVMEFVDAPSLRKVLRRSLSVQETVGIMHQACSALGFAHENNVVHRDIKPENILVSGSGVVTVLDFGIAKLTSAATVTTDKIVGTPEYISPEQARGEPVQPASDVYSLGIVLYEMLTGSVPFPRPDVDNAYRAAMEIIRQHLKERPEPIRKRNPEAQVSGQLERVTMRALEKDIKKRYATGHEMGKALGSKKRTVGISTSLGRATPDGARRQAQASLHVLEGPRQGHSFPLSAEAFALGRFELGSSNSTISRRHVNISYRGGTYWLQDTSKNGTLVDNRRVYGEVPLRAGTIIVIGDNVLTLEQA